MLVFINSLELEQTDKEFVLWLYQKYKNIMYLTAKKQIFTFFRTSVAL